MRYKHIHITRKNQEQKHVHALIHKYTHTYTCNHIHMHIQRDIEIKKHTHILHHAHTRLETQKNTNMHIQSQTKANLPQTCLYI